MTSRRRFIYSAAKGLMVPFFAAPVIRAASIVPFNPQIRTVAASIPTRTLKTWSGAGQWVYSTDTPFTSSDVSVNKYLRVTSGTGWTQGWYPILQILEGFDTGADGAQNMIRLGRDAAAAGTGGGVGYVDSQTSGYSYVYAAEGDSITYGLGAVPYAAYVKRDKGADWKIHNSGVSGATLSDMISQYSSAIAPEYDAGKLSVLSIFGGTNDLYSLGSTAAQVLTRIDDLGQEAVDDGWIVMVATMLPRSGGSTPGSFETDRTTINTALRADFPTSTAHSRVFKASGITYGHYLIDLAANSTIGDAGDETNTTYYQDLVHPTEAGQDLIDGDFSNGLTLAVSEHG